MAIANSQHCWGDADIAFLRQQYGNISVDNIATALDKSVSAVQSKVYSLGLKVVRKEAVPALEVKKLKASGLTIVQVAQKLNITVHQVNHCLYHSKDRSAVYTPRRRARWTKAKEAELIRLAQEQTSVEVIANKLDVTPAAVRIKASYLKLKLTRLKRSYSQRDIDLAYQMHDAGFSTRAIAEKLDDPPISRHTVLRILSNESPSWEMI